MIIDHKWYTKPKNIKERESAGWIIMRKENNVLLVALMYDKKFPFNYELPKGGIEKDEEKEIAARREIAEEIGLTDLQMICFLDKQERLSFSKRSWAIIYYYLFVTKQKEGIPTDHTKEFVLEWFPIDKLPEMFWPEQEKLIEENKEKIKQLI